MSHNTSHIQRVLVTGASGFVGGRVVEALHRSQIATPVAGIRNWSRAARVARFPVEIVICDILDYSQVCEVVSNVDAIIHCAYTNDNESIVQGTRKLLSAAVEYNVKRFVYLSSAEVYGTDASGVVTESQTLTPTGNDYADAKLEAESLCREAADNGLPTTILRPSLIYGPFSAAWTVAVAKRLQSGNWGMFEQYGEGVANLVHVDDLVQAICLSLMNEDTQCEAFNINGPERITWNEYFSRFNKALDLPPLQSIAPQQSRFRTAVMDQIGRVSDAILDRFEDHLMKIYLRGGLASRAMKWLKSELDSTPSGDELRRLYSRDAMFCDDKARTLLGYQPTIDLETGLQTSVAWLRHHYLVPGSQAVANTTPKSHLHKPNTKSITSNGQPLYEDALS